MWPCHHYSGIKKYLRNDLNVQNFVRFTGLNIIGKIIINSYYYYYEYVRWKYTFSCISNEDRQVKILLIDISL